MFQKVNTYSDFENNLEFRVRAICGEVVLFVRYRLQRDDCAVFPLKLVMIEFEARFFVWPTFNSENY